MPMQGYYVVDVRGGLGNQLFQYAYGRYLAKREGVPLYLDLSYFEHDKYRPYMLGLFNINAAPLSLIRKHYTRLAVRSRWLPVRAMRWCSRRLLPGSLPAVIDERSKCFDPRHLEVKPPAYLLGYWQSEKYFPGLRQTLLDELKLRVALTGKNLEMAGQIEATESVSLHVRRGDYVSQPYFNQLLGTCSIDYYKAALAHVTSRCSKPVVYVFSDDPDWTRQNICPNLPVVYVDHNSSENCHEDLRLMSLCRHNIIANSTFSWWGAWLNTYPDKIVCGPQRWYQDESQGNPDIVPDTWTKC